MKRIVLIFASVFLFAAVSAQVVTTSVKHVQQVADSYPDLLDYADSVWANNFENITSGYTANHYLVHRLSASGDSVDNYFDIAGEGFLSSAYGVDPNDPYDQKVMVVSMADSTGGEVTGTNSLQIRVNPIDGATNNGATFIANIPSGHRELYFGYRFIWRIDDGDDYWYDPMEYKIPALSIGYDDVPPTFSFILRNRGTPIDDSATFKSYVSYDALTNQGGYFVDPDNTSINFEYDLGSWDWVHVIQRVSLNSGYNDDFIEWFINGVCVNRYDPGDDFSASDIDAMMIRCFESNQPSHYAHIWPDQFYLLDPGGKGYLKEGTSEYSIDEEIYAWPGLDMDTKLTYNLDEDGQPE